MASTTTKQKLAKKKLATIDDLPEEMLQHCCQHADIESLKEMRLTCKKLMPSATKQLFAHIEVKPTDKSYARYEAVVESNGLKGLVKSITFNTSLYPDANDNNNHEGQDYETWRKEACFPQARANATTSVGQLPKLQKVFLKFATECAVEEEDRWPPKDVPETVEFRSHVLNTLLDGLLHPVHPAVNIRHLSIINLQDYFPQDSPSGMLLERLVSLIQQLHSLELQVTTEYDDAAPESSIRIPALHQCFGNTLTTALLSPVQTNLQRLSLGTSEMEWGFYPYCDLSTVHFPNLKSLSLLRMTFAFDAQLDWIVSHKDTLESLTLANCPILHAGSNEPTWSPRTPPMSKVVHFQTEWGNYDIWLHETRWHNQFRRIKDELMGLRYFVLSDGDSESSSFKSDLRSGASLPFTYMVFDSGVGPCQYVRYGEGEGCEDEDEDEDGPTKYQFADDVNVAEPNCWEEDTAALEDLFASIRARVKRTRPT